MSTEEDAVIDTEHEIRIGIREKDGDWKLDTNVYEVLSESFCGVISTETLGVAFEPEEKFENPDGTPIIFQYDYFGKRHQLRPLPGPLASKEESGAVLACSGSVD